MRFKYLRAAFNERVGMPVPMSWMILAFTALGTYLDWGAGLIGIGALSLYLFLLSNSARYARVVDGRELLASQRSAMEKVQRQLLELDVADAARYREMVARCDAIVEQQQSDVPGELKQQAMGLSRLACFYLQLLVSKTAMENIPCEEDAPTINRNIVALNKRLAVSTSADLTRSLQGQLSILKQRLAARHEMSERLAYIRSELERIDQQVELLREQTVANTAPRIVTERIDAVTSTLSDANEWMKQNRDLLGEVDDMLSETPPVLQILRQK